MGDRDPATVSKVLAGKLVAATSAQVSAEVRAIHSVDHKLRKLAQTAQESAYTLWSTLSREQALRREQHDQLLLQNGPIRVYASCPFRRGPVDDACPVPRAHFISDPVCLCVLSVWSGGSRLRCRQCRIRPLTSTERSRGMAPAVRPVEGNMVEVRLRGPPVDPTVRKKPAQSQVPGLGAGTFACVCTSVCVSMDVACLCTSVCVSMDVACLCASVCVSRDVACLCASVCVSMDVACLCANVCVSMNVACLCANVCVSRDVACLWACVCAEGDCIRGHTPSALLCCASNLCCVLWPCLLW
jgi:hypothetical protein